MKNIIRLIGILFFSMLMYAIPIMLTLSIVLKWAGFIQFGLIIISIVQFVALITYVQAEVDGE